MGWAFISALITTPEHVSDVSGVPLYSSCILDTSTNYNDHT